MSNIQQAKRIVVKVGTSTLTYANGKVNIRAVDALCRVLCDLQNAGHEMVLVSSGAVGVGVGKLGLAARPKALNEKQACAAVGQCELMFLYDKLCSEYHQTVAQILLTYDVTAEETKRRNVINTFASLMKMGVIPVVNENDTVATDELEGEHFGDNDTLSAIVAELTEADLLVLFTDIDGLYTADPRKDPNATKIDKLVGVSDSDIALAGGAGSARGTGGMHTKLVAARHALKCGIPTVIMAGDTPARLYDLLNGESVGTLIDKE